MMFNLRQFFMAYFIEPHLPSKEAREYYLKRFVSGMAIIIVFIIKIVQWLGSYCWVIIGLAIILIVAEDIKKYVSNKTTHSDEVIINNGVKIIGISNLASSVSNHASLALSNNYNHWITDFYNKEENNINFDFEDEIIKSSVLVFNGKIVNERFK